MWDALRCALRLVAQCGELRQDTRWRQWQHHTRQVRKAFRQTQKLRPSTAKDPARQAERKQAIDAAHETYLKVCSQHLLHLGMTQQHWEVSDVKPGTPEAQLQQCIGYGWKQIDLIRRRVLQGETIPHHEKIFSIFEDYTEWLSKGKAGVPVELGLNVCILEDSHGFILHHRVMQHCTDKDVAVPMVKETLARFPQLAVCSFDKGFHSPDNQKQLAALLEQAVLPAKGRLSQARQAIEHDPAFRQARRQHSAVESGINALEVHGLDRCPDRGLDHFKRYVALAVVGRNLQKIGAILQAEALKQLQRQERRRAA